MIPTQKPKKKTFSKQPLKKKRSVITDTESHDSDFESITISTGSSDFESISISTGSEDESSSNSQQAVDVLSALQDGLFLFKKII